MFMSNNMMCDLTTGICGDVGNETEMQVIDFSQPREVIDLYYFTDPICSHCWALEPALRKFQAQYGKYFRFHTVMGGLLKEWNGFADKANGIGGPADVAGHWREVGEHSRMPIDGSVWLEDPIHSSYPPSRVFAVIKKKDPELANVFLRKIREALFVFNQNIAKDDVLIDILNGLNLNGEEIIKEAHSSEGETLLQQEFSIAKNLGVRGFPTIIMVNEENKGVKLVGARSVSDYVSGLKEVLLKTDKVEPKALPTLEDLLDKEELLFSKEIEVMYDIDQKDILSFIEKELQSKNYEEKEILGERYIERK